MDAAERVAAEVVADHDPMDEALEVWIVVHIPKPKTNTSKYPINQRSGDIDNHIKAVLDAFNPDEGARAKRKTGRGWPLSQGLWTDDCRIQTLHTSKVWAPPDSEGWIEIAVKEKK